jgi:hypothetical protein
MAGKRGVYVRSKISGNGCSLAFTFYLITILIVIGIIFSITMAPRADESSSGPGTNSIVSEHAPLMLSHKVLDWIPGKGGRRTETERAFPDWSRQFWNPIDLDTFSRDPEVTLCQLNFKKYSESPHLYPMFRDFEGVSDCHGNNRRRERMSTLMRELKDAAAKGLPEGRVVAPTAFVFHESRVGSTLVANSLASDPFSMVYSESAPAANALLHCKACPDEESVKLFRDIVTLMGRSPIHRRLFFKFQSITCTRMHIALKAFPETPWVFVYRRSVQTMMSHLDPKKGGGTGAPCLRSMRDTPDEVRKALVAAGASTSNAPKEAWCAAHLNMLCSHALDSYEQFGRYNDTHQRGFLVNYESLPGSIARLLLPSFGVEPSDHWLERMAEESKQYSKGRSTSRPFFGDSQDKEERATKTIQKYAASILDPTFERMAEISASALRQISPELFDRIATKGEDGHTEVNWQLLKDLPL